MGKKLKDLFGAFWNILGPLIVYEVIVGFTCSVLAVVACATMTDMESFLDTCELLGQKLVLLVSTLGSAVAILPLGAWYLYWRGSDGGAREGRAGHYFGVSSMFRMAVFGACICVLGNALIMEIPISWDSYEEASEDFYYFPVSVQMICVGLIVPLAEELVFRGLGYDRVCRRISIIPAAIVSSVFFGIVHGNMVQAVYAGGMGLFLAGVMEWYGTLTAPYLLHASANMMSVVLSNTVLGGLIGAFASVRRAVILIFICLTIYLMNRIRKDGNRYEAAFNSDTMF